MTTVAAYRASLERGVTRRAFPLEAQTIIVPSGRTLTKLAAWKGHWPALREFLQNTIDHLQLLDGATGRRQEALRLDVSKGGDDDDTIAAFTFRMVDDNTVVCTIVAQPNRLVIEQHYTFPLPSRALDTGVPDTTKQGGSHSTTAGGFGDGFKTAAVALLAQDPQASLVWYFLPHTIEWHFEGKSRPAVGSFAKSRVLQVRIIQRDATTTPLATLPPRDNIMRQVIVSNNIGRSFVEEAVPRLQVFWDWGGDPNTVISTRGGDLVGLAQAQPPIGGGVLGVVKPAPGVYVRGIWVRPSKITGTVMSLFGKRLQVTGRDRNEVDHEALVEAVVYVLKKTKQKVLLNDLLKPLRGSGGTAASTNSSWLLRSPRFFNCVLEQQKEFVLHTLLGIPAGSIFVSRRITTNSDPFIQWASSYLQRKGAPLVPIERGANRILFQEVSETELKQRCVQLLTKDLRASKIKGSSVEVLRSAFRKLLTFMGGASVHVLFSADVHVAFVHGRHIFVPEAPLTRELLVKVLNACQVHLGGIWDGEKFSSVVQAIFEQLPAGRQRSLTVADVDLVVKRAKQVVKENAEFLAATNGTSDMTTATEDVVPRKSRKMKKSSTTTLRSYADLEEQIQKVTRQRRGRSDDDMIIPPAHFGKDDAGQESCLVSNSTLESVAVDACLGGGSLLCDAASVSDIDSGAWDTSTRGRICVLRSILNEAVALVRRSIPSLAPLLARVRHGYDAVNDTYDAFCDGRQVVINLYSYMSKLPSGASNAPWPRTLIHDFVVTVTHELAHFLEPSAGHGPVWRDTHMKMVMEVMAMYASNKSEALHDVSDEGSSSFPVRKRKQRS